MALITRLSRLFHADINAVLDHIEEPDLVLKQAIREMQDTLSHRERKMKLIELDRKKHLRKQEELFACLADLDQQLRVCFDSDKDDLARVLIKRKLETNQVLKAIQASITNSLASSEQLNNQLMQEQSQLSSMKQKADIFAQDNTAKNDEQSWQQPSFIIQAEDVEVAFLQEKKKWRQS